MPQVDVDSIWGEMRREQLGQNDVKVIDISSLQREKRRPAGQRARTKVCKQSWSTSLQARGAGAVSDVSAMRLTEPPATLIDVVDQIPTGTPETCLAYLQRDINCLGEDSLNVRLQSLHKLEHVLVQNAEKLPTDVVDAVSEHLLKTLLKRLKDKSEKCRELSIKILKSLVENSSDLSPMLPYIFPTLVGRLGCEDLDGVAHLPEVARPSPEQKPTEIARPVEESEEVRRELAHFVRSLLARCNQTQIYSYIDEATGLLRAQAMDPFHEVKALACETMIAFCYNHTEMLLHFAEPLGRSLTSCLTHNHAKIRIAALRALVAVFHCGVWKHNFEVLQMLMAWQDPNKVPVKAFYEAVTNVNYMSTLTFDRHPAVRRFWFETLAYILLRIPDKVDHEPYIFPYLLTGLCDENEEIALEVFWLIERCGELYENEHEGDLRKTKQYGFDFGWTYDGRACVPFPLQGVWAGGGYIRLVRRTAAHGPDLMGEKDLHEHHLRDRDVNSAAARPGEVGEHGQGVGASSEDCASLRLPARDYSWPELQDLEVRRSLPRPRLGSRCWVRTHTRRYIKATFNDVVDFRDCTALNAGRLLCMSLAYTEEGVTEWLQPMVAALCKFYSGRAWAAKDTQAARTYDCVCKLLGAFLDPVSYWEQLKDALDANSSLDFGQRVASLKILTLCVEGSIETLLSIEDPDPALGMGRLKPVIPALITALHASDLLLAPSDESRDGLWRLVFSFVIPLRRHLSSSQVSQLLFIALALAAKAPRDDDDVDAVSAPPIDEEQIEDADKLNRLLSTLGACTGPAQAPETEFDLDSLDDVDAEVKASSDPRVCHRVLFEQALSDVFARLEDSFQVFRNVMYLTPLPVLTSADHVKDVLERLAAFCGPSSSPSVRMAAQALCVRLELRSASALECEQEATSAHNLRSFMGKVAQLLGKAQMDGSSNLQCLSYSVIVSGLSLWRQLFLCPAVDSHRVLFAHGEQSSARPLRWFVSLLADQELHKKFYAVLERAETLATGQDRESFVMKKAKQIRDESERCANVVRTLAASTLLVAWRRLLLDGTGIACEEGFARELFFGVASLFRTATPTMDPPFVKPTPAHLTLYAAELLHLLLCQASQVAAAPFRLCDDAARAIQQLSVPSSSPCLLVSLEAEERETLVSDFVSALTGLNLNLPPDPQAKHAPATLDDSAKEIAVGWDELLLLQGGAPTPTTWRVSRSLSSTTHQAASVPTEVTRLLAQSTDCLRWNAALALYTLGVDLSIVCQDGFTKNLVRWRQRKEQAKILITVDLLERAHRALA